MKRNAGFSLVELLIVISIISILTTIAIPNYVGQRTLAYNSTAESMAKNFRTCQGAYRELHEGYATNINQLLTVDKNLLDTPGLTFLWILAQSDDYVFNVRHERGDRWYTEVP
ncbi:MAG: prepilin-type N-terminal cleavage/methylation domain-containing protein [Candidatus Lernaella stagnicola]|nr:prepilin-type N-terminal cleavage/methylation domain-containing protein [Candidatus Lernaella stagnicola]